MIRGGPHSIGEQLFLCGDKPISVGKSETVDVRLPGERVSRKHCELLATSQGWRIEDRGSTNGVVVNNVRTRLCLKTS